MNPKNRMEKAIALKAIADKTEELEKAGANPVDIAAFTSGAREKLAEERPDPDKYAKAALLANKWATQNA